MFEEVNDYLPYSLDAEQAVIGAILLKNEIILDAIDLVEPEQFYLKSHQDIYHAMNFLSESGQPCDVVTLSNLLKSQSLLESVGGLAYLAELAQYTPSSANMKAYAKVVVDKFKERQVLNLSYQMKDEIESSDDTSENRINNALGYVNGLDLSEGKERSLNKVLHQVVLDLEERASRKGISGLSTGFKDIDERTAGLQKTDLIILAARPAMGKTTLAMNIAQNSLNIGDGATLVFSMEMSAEQLAIRMISSNSSVFLNKYRDGSMDRDEWQKTQAGFAKLKNKPLVIDDRPALTPQQVRAKALREKRKHGSIKLIVIDYLQLMRTNKSENRTNEIGEISRSLKALAKEMECPVIALSQLNRGVESRQDKKPLMSDLRESGSIEQDADMIWFLYRDEVYNPEGDRQGVAELITSKFRNGEIGSDFLKSELYYSRFKDLIGWEEPEQQTETNKAPFQKWKKG